MARLTRTQKYADLRDRIAQDREESLRTESLTPYEDKLKSLENYFNNEPDTNLERKTTIEPVVNEEVKQEPVVVEEVKEEPQTKVEDEQEIRLRSLDEILNSMMESTSSFTNEAPAVEIKEEPVVQTIEEEKIEDVAEVGEPVKEEIIPQDIPVPAPVIPEEKPVEVNPVDIMSTMEIITSEVNELSNIIDSGEEVEDKPVKVEEKKEEIVEETKPVNNSFIDRALEEALDYNKQEGNETLVELSNSIIDQVRHPEGVAKEETVEDSEFSNTVSLEIDKVLNEIKKQQEEKANAEATSSNVVYKEAELVAQEAFEKTVSQETINEHPVLAKELEEPVVEIKNLSETIQQTITETNILDDTIPFDVEKVAESNIEEEEDEEEAPSKVLNVILGILIFVLVAVLGVIVYYILVAKGILG